MERTSSWSAALAEPDLLDAPVVLRPVRLGDARVLRGLHLANKAWLSRWEPSDPGTCAEHPAGGSLLSAARRSPIWPYLTVARIRWENARRISLSWAVCYDGRLVGQLTIWSIAWGSLKSAQISYWIDESCAGRGIIPTALAMAADYCFRVIGLHRLEAGIRPENVASRRVVEKLGFRDEGTRVRQLYIDGAWRDHVYYAITVDEVAAGLLSRWQDSRTRALPEGGIARE